jgi:hypothetical protein
MHGSNLFIEYFTSFSANISMAAGQVKKFCPGGYNRRMKWV